MHNVHDFYESYYEHTCLIMPEKDVLDSDIHSVGWIGCLQRWWNDLFLLSYTSARSRSFYASPNAMRIERFRQFRHYKNRIHPMSKFRNFWDFLMMHVIIMNKILFHFTSTFLFDKIPTFFFYFGALFELIIIVDLYISTKTGYIDMDAKRVVLDTKRSMRYFCTKKIFFHFASAIPLHWLMILRFGANIDCGLCKTNNFTCVLKIISIFGLFRVYETSGYWVEKRLQLDKIRFFRFLRIGTVGLITMLQFFDLSDVLCLMIFIQNGHVPPNSILGLRTVMKYGPLENVVLNYKSVIADDLSRILKSFLLFSFTSKGMIHHMDMISSLVAYLIANAFYAWSLLECFALISSLMYQADQLMKMKKSGLNFLVSTQVSDELRSKVNQYYDFKPTRTQLTQRKNELYKCLPKVLKDEIELSCYMNLLMRISLFCDFPLPVVEELVLMLKKRVYLNNDIVTLAWIHGEGLMIVDDGVLAVYSQFHKELGHLIDGDYFGEVSLVTDKEVCMSYVVAITTCTFEIMLKRADLNWCAMEMRGEDGEMLWCLQFSPIYLAGLKCEILFLGKMAFRKHMQKYPKLFYDFKKQIKKNYNSSVSSSNSHNYTPELPPKYST